MTAKSFSTAKKTFLIALLAYAALAALGLFLLHSWIVHVKGDSVNSALRTVACAAVSALGDEFIDKAASKDAISDSEKLESVELISSFRCRSCILKRIYIAFHDGVSFRYVVSSATKEEREKGSYLKPLAVCAEDSSALSRAYSTNEAIFWEAGSGGEQLRFSAIPLKTKAGHRFIVCASSPCGTIAPSNYDTLGLFAGYAVFALLLALPFAFLFRRVAASAPGQAAASTFDWRQAQLIHAGRLVAMGEMTAGIAHEINQPLCVIRGYLELLQSVLANEPILKERQLDGAFDIGIKSVDKASRIINHMRSFVRLKPGEPKPISLRAPLEEGLSFFNEQIKLHNIQLAMNFEEGVPSVRIDQQKFEQVVVNLVANSRYSVDEKGELLGRSFKKRVELKLRFDKSSGRVVFEVEDNGLGMTKEVLENCGKLFFTTKKPGEGTGLGVSIVKEILKEFDGDLKFRSVEGEGSVFTVSFPPAAAEPPPAAKV